MKQAEFEFGDRPGELDLFGPNPQPPAPFEIPPGGDDAESESE